MRMPAVLRSRPASIASGFVATLAVAVASAAEPFAAWKRSGSIHLITTPAGADLAAGTEVEGFPVLVRLHGDTFDFAAAAADGRDLRFATATGEPLPHEIESWDAAAGEAVVWVRVPRIEGNAVQRLQVWWGNPAAADASDGRRVFDKATGHLGVWHMAATVADSTGALDSRDTGTAAVPGVIGGARRLAGRGVACGTEIETLPTGAGPHTTQAWLRPERTNVLVLGWGNEAAQGKVTMNVRSPPHVSMDCYFSAGNVEGKRRLQMGEWVHVVHTYREGDSRVYVDGVLDGVSPHAGPPLKITRPARLWLGGWYDNYSFAGDLDEVRLAGVVRSPAWIRLEYENQKPAQTLVGHVVAAGDELEVSPARLDLAEGASGTVTARAGGAVKLAWVLVRDGRERVVATDRLSCTIPVGRVAAPERAKLELRAVYPDGLRTRAVEIAIADTLPDPQLALEPPDEWDGRTPLEIVPRLVNRSALDAAGLGDVGFSWQLSGPVVRRATAGGGLQLRRALMSGPLEVAVTASSGGQPVTARATIQVREPPADPWLPRPPQAEDRPVDGRFYPRDGDGLATVPWNGRLDPPAAAVALRAFAGDRQVAAAEARPDGDGRFGVSVRLPADLVTYRLECLVDGRTVHQAADVLCGDVFLIVGQSNAVATDFGKDEPPPSSPWVRTFGSTAGGPAARLERWFTAVQRAPEGAGEIGYWGVELGRTLAERRGRPICIVNGAVGGTRIDQHQRNDADPTDAGTIYGRLLWRVRAAGLAHGVRGVIWHQGESDQGADGPTGGYGWETYRMLFHELAADWQDDYPNLQHIHMFQIWPRACSMGRDGSDDRLREVQRRLPRDFSRLSIMSTLGIQPPGGCHYPAAGYAEFARLLAPLMERDHDGARQQASVTPPDLVRARFASPARDAIELEFDQPVAWRPEAAAEFVVGGRRGLVRSGGGDGRMVSLRLAEPAPAPTLSYIEGGSWSQERILRGANGIAVLTFCEVPIEAGDGK